MSTPTRSVADFIHVIEQPQTPTLETSDSNSLHDILLQFGVAALSIAVIYDFRIHWVKAYGTANLIEGAKASTDTLFQAASLSKPVTAMAVMKAIEQGHFGLYDDVRDLLADWPILESAAVAAEPITPLMLMSHSAGLGDGYGYPGYAPSSELPTLDQILRGKPPCNVAAVARERPPMSAAKYSGASYSLLQKLLEETYQQPFEALMQALVFKPLAMQQSTFQQPLPDPLQQQAAQGADGYGAALSVPWHIYPEQAAAGLWTTASDLAKLLIEVQRSLQGESNRVLQRATVQCMANPVGIGDFAAGFAIARRGEGWYLQHIGDNRGYKNWLCGHKAKGYGCVLMSTGEKGAAALEIIQRRIERAYGWDSLDAPLQQ